MRRVIVGAATAALMVTPGLASAANTTYRGEVEGDPAPSLVIKVGTSGEGERNVKSINVRRLGIRCEGGVAAKLAILSATGTFPVGDQGRFRARVEDGPRVFKIRGEFGKGKRARGTLRYFGPTKVDGQTRDCDSTTVEWKASR